ncbi:hypothetical protein DPEC_G00206550 [Dallia pectoralis]|uniref:Uncharacterized protein n=1 Tax=Dallia pectoralis TaxID=75939 RepID=A0ACC2G4V9_DALPE|nr:hypothetical protein DPEC_G00206550 [Dallia pectoralis]
MAVGFMSRLEELLVAKRQVVWTLVEQTLRRWSSQGLIPARRFLQVWWRFGEFYQTMGTESIYLSNSQTFTFGTLDANLTSLDSIAADDSGTESEVMFVEIAAVTPPTGSTGQGKPGLVGGGGGGLTVKMTEGRLCLVLLLDDRKLELLVQPKLLSRDLLDLVSSHFNLKEKEYFGISFVDDTGQSNWLQLDRRVLDHDFTKKTGPLELKFLVRFYIEKITFLKENTTVELFYLNAKSGLVGISGAEEVFEVESEHVFRLAALVLQEAKGDYTDVETSRSDLKKLHVLPTRVLREHPSLAYCEDRVIEHHENLKGLSRGQAIVQYLALAESLPTYGVYYYLVKDKQGLPWWLGVSYKGIGQYDVQDKLKPRKLFQWKQLENLYFREKKFAVEVNDPHRRPVSRRTFGQAGLVIHAWYASHSLIKTIWAMAISQHQFYLDRKQIKSKVSKARSLGDIAMDLNEVEAPRISKMSSIGSKNQLIMASNGSLISAGSLDFEVSEEQKREKIADLKQKAKDLQDTLTQKEEELRNLCLREAELTGILPQEYPQVVGEKLPAVQRRVGATFKLDEPLTYDADPHLRNLEYSLALQQKIVQADKKIAGEIEPSRTVKKKRRKNYQDSMKKLQEIEEEINKYRIQMGKNPTERASIISSDDVNISELSSLSDCVTLNDDEEPDQHRQRSCSVQYSPRSQRSDPSYYQPDRRASALDQLQDHGPNSRLNNGEVQEYSRGNLLSSYYPSSRQPHDARSMPPTPLLTRHAQSSTQLRPDDGPQHFRQRSGSLESQSRFLVETTSSTATLVPARRSNSTDVLDDGSSYTSQSSAEYTVYGNHGRHPRHGRKVNAYANTGSMPNLLQSDPRYNTCQPHRAPRPTTTAYYVTGYPSYPEPEPHPNGVYMYDHQVEGQYNVNPSYYLAPAYRGQNVYGGRYGDNEMDSMAQNPYATMGRPRNRPAPPRTEHGPRDNQKELVAEHLRGWYKRNASNKQPQAYEYESRGSQPSLGYQSVGHQSVGYQSVGHQSVGYQSVGHQSVGYQSVGHQSVGHQSVGHQSVGYQSVGHQNMSAPFNRTTSYSSVSSQQSSTAGAWHGHSGGGTSEYDIPVPQPYSSYGTAHYLNPAHSRSYIDVNQADPYTNSQIDDHNNSQVNYSLDPDDQRLYWHEGSSKPGTIV